MGKEKQALHRILKQIKNDSDKDYIKIWFRNSQDYCELIDPVVESKEVNINGKTYYCSRSAFVSWYDARVNYGYSVYEWTGNYFEKELSPVTKTKFRFKEWKEIFHTHSETKINPEEMISKALALRGLTGSDKNDY